MEANQDIIQHDLGPIINRDQSLIPVRIESLIHIIREQQVMLDSDLARLYGVETKVLNQAVKRNIQRFPEDFMFQLTKDECLRSQIVTLNEGRGRHLKYLPHAFTENGVAMLSSVLRSDKAIEVNINIMRAFSAMRNFLMNNAAIFQRMDQLEMKQLKTDEKVDAILDKLGGNDNPKEGVFFNGQIFDAYVLIADFIRQAEKRIVVIDNYIDDSVLVQLGKAIIILGELMVFRYLFLVLWFFWSSGTCRNSKIIVYLCDVPLNLLKLHFHERRQQIHPLRLGDEAHSSRQGQLRYPGGPHIRIA